MSPPPDPRRRKGADKTRAPFRRNRSTKPRQTDWTQQARDAEDHELDVRRGESVVAKGDLSRKRTVNVPDADAPLAEGLRRGVVVSMRGLFADVDDGEHVWPCTVRRVLRTRLIEERHPVTTGDRVHFRVESDTAGVAKEGVIEAVEPRRGALRRRTGRRIHTIVANVDQAILVSSTDLPAPKPHLIDRYIVASHVGEITPIICMNKTDLDPEGNTRELVARYADLGYKTLYTSAVSGEGMEALKQQLKDKASVIAGQSGVGKSSLLNLVQPDLRLETGDVVEHTSKGRHTTSTATLHRLDMGGYVVDTPGVKSFDLSTVERGELEALFVEFLDHVPNCKFPDCTHRHEGNCAIKEAVGRGKIHPERYESYVRMFEEPTEPDWETRTE
ncbi:MAG: ribosome small subunit-dependent GTPase A [Phycisphaerae bacterium]|jgi:ribosome biogenesis GTPase